MGVRERRREKEKKAEEVERPAEIEPVEIETPVADEAVSEVVAHSPDVIVEKEVVVEQAESSIAPAESEVESQTVTTLPPPWEISTRVNGCMVFQTERMTRLCGQRNGETTFSNGHSSIQSISCQSPHSLESHPLTR